MQNDLNKNKVDEFLKFYGYESNDADYCISKLKSRLKNSASFPHEIGIFLRHAAQQLTEQRIVAVDVVHDGETDRLLVGIQRGHIIGFVFVDPAGCDPARNHALVATVFENSLREDAVTVTGSRLSPVTGTRCRRPMMRLPCSE